MKKIHSTLALICLTAALSSCSNQSGFLFSGSNPEAEEAAQEGKGLVGTSVDKSGNETNTKITMTGGGEIGVRSMNADDRLKMSRALDAGIGKSTHWQNGVTGVGYTVTPTQKVTVRGNPFCRQYTVQAERKGFSRNISGTACVTTDGTWHTI